MNVAGQSTLARMARPWLGILGLALLVLLAAFWLAWPAVQSTLTGDMPKAYWMLSRASGLVAFVLAWGGVMLGLSMTTRLAPAWPGGPQAFDLHRFCTLLSLGFAVFHAGILLGDRYIDATLWQVLLPFGFEGYEPVWVGLGQCALYVSLLLAGSFYARRWITQRGWRMLHFASFAVFAAVLAHAWLSGTDSTSILAQLAYAGAGLSVVALTALRIRRARAGDALLAPTVRQPDGDG